MHPDVTDFFQNPAVDCLLVAHREILQLEQIKGEILATYQIDYLPIGQELSAAMLTTPQAARSRAARVWLETAVREKAPGPLICGDIDLLFHPTFDLDPVWLFRQISRFTRLLVLWPGTFRDGVLAYAVPEHAHYRTWRQPPIHIVGGPDALS